MTSCVMNMHTKNYKNLITGFQVTVENVGDVYVYVYVTLPCSVQEFMSVSPCFALLQVCFLYFSRLQLLQAQ